MPNGEDNQLAFLALRWKRMLELTDDIFRERDFGGDDVYVGHQLGAMAEEARERNNVPAVIYLGEKTRQEVEEMEPDQNMK